MLLFMKMYPLLYAVISLGLFHINIINASENSHPTYFKERQNFLKNMNVTFIKRPKSSNVPKLYYDNPQPYKHDFKRLINEPDLCSQHERVLLLYTIRTVYSHFGRREVLRKIFQLIPYDTNSKHIIVKHIFLFGKPNNSTIDSLIQKESKEYRDILQEDFIDSYKNVSLKSIMAWKWSIEFCANTDYVMVMNDELFVDQYKLIFYLHYHLTLNKHDKTFAICYATGNSKTNYKFFTAKHMDMSGFYKGKKYPWFCHGVGYVAHIYFINKLYIASLHNQVFMPDDVWNGLLAEKLNASLEKKNYFFEFKRPLETFSHPMYKFNELMFLVTDIHANKNHEEELFKNLSDILEIQRPLYYNEIPETLLKRRKKYVAGRQRTNYVENFVRNSNNCDIWTVSKYIFMMFIFYKIFKQFVKSRIWSTLCNRVCK